MTNLINAIKENKFDPASKSFQENLFEYYKVTGYSNYWLNKLSQEIGINPNILKAYIYSYMKENLNIKKEEFDKYIENNNSKDTSEEAKLSEYMKEISNLFNEETKLNYEKDLDAFLKKSGITIKRGFELEEISFDEKLFRYYKSFNYSRLALSDVSKKIDIKSTILKEYIYSYAKSKFGMEKEEFDNFIKEEKEKNKELYIGRINVVLEAKEININYLWTDENEKEMFLKGIYEYSSKHEFSIESTKAMALKLHISNKKYLEFIKLYMVEYLKKTQVEVNNIVNLNLSVSDQRRVNNRDILNLFNEIINSNSAEEIDNIVLKVEYSFAHLKENLDLSKRFFKEEQIEIYEQKMSEYKEYRNEKRKEIIRQTFDKKNIEKLEENRKCIEIYMKESDKSHDEILRMLGLTEKEFKSKLEFIKRNDNELYTKFIKYQKEKQINNIAKKGNGMENILNCLVNGVEENGRIRSFDILDYFSLTDMPTLNFFRSFSNLDKKVYFKLKDFATKNRHSDKEFPGDYKLIMEEKLVIGVKTDEKGNIIPDSGREIQKEEKEQVINYLKELNFPVNRHTYRAALKRYTDGFLTFDSTSNTLSIKLTRKENS